MQCEEQEQREGESGGESFLLPCRGHFSQVRLSPCKPPRGGGAASAEG